MTIRTIDLFILIGVMALTLGSAWLPVRRGRIGGGTTERDGSAGPDSQAGSVVRD